MDRNEEIISKRYDALMFARTPEEAKRSARLLAEAVLGEAGLALSLERAMKEVCRKLRPASDPRDQTRFEAEFLELVFSPTNSEHSATQANTASPVGRSKAA
jgi:hypothetical protein